MELSELCNSLVNTSIRINIDSIELLKKLNKRNFDRYKAVLEKRDESLPFNLFQILSPKFYYENLHSQILSFLLRKDECFTSFIDLLRNVDKENFQLVSIKTEFVCENNRRIDILITGEDKSKTKHAIIIENKIHNATDQTDQLDTYYKDIEKRGYIIDKVIYLVSDNKKKPSLESLAGNLELTTDKKLQIIAGFDATNKDLVSCLENVNSNEENYNFLLKHYIALLKQTGAGSMTYVAQKFVEELYSLAEQDSETIEKIRYINKMTSSNEFLLARMHKIKILIDEKDFKYNPILTEEDFDVSISFTDEENNEWIVSISCDYLDENYLLGFEKIIYINPSSKNTIKNYKSIFETFKDLLKSKNIIVTHEYDELFSVDEGYIGWKVKKYKDLSEDKLATQEAVQLFNNLKKYVEEWNLNK